MAVSKAQALRNARAKAKAIRPATVVEFRDPPPARRAAGGKYIEVLAQLLTNRSRWAMVMEFDTPDKAAAAQRNLHQRKVRIPQPDHLWEFAARGCELFAVYRGPKSTPIKRTRRK